MFKSLRHIVTLPLIRFWRALLIIFGTGVALLWRGTLKSGHAEHNTLFLLLVGGSLAALLASFLIKTKDS